MEEFDKRMAAASGSSQQSSTKKGTPMEIRPRGYKTIFMLNSAEHEISTAHKN